MIVCTRVRLHTTYSYGTSIGLHFFLFEKGVISVTGPLVTHIFRGGGGQTKFLWSPGQVQQIEVAKEKN